MVAWLKRLWNRICRDFEEDRRLYGLGERIYRSGRTPETEEERLALHIDEMGQM
ncbi:hypothetical protein [Paenirhodobacter populi]|uniref:hypothetical protein n=1 Tax=Paenirhodobacter populi TaxID=2306993 RepID=UPI0013E2D611|nr:hypothetical protein [Sinirhodobacter populi]